MAKQKILQIAFPPDVQQGLELIAKSENTTVEQYAENCLMDLVVTEGVLPSSAIRRIKAERRLFSSIGDYLESFRKSGNWPEEITLLVFRFVKDCHLELYQTAIANGQQSRINRQVGATVKFRLRAAVKLMNGKRVVHQVSRKERALITSYTALVPPTEGYSND